MSRTHASECFFDFASTSAAYSFIDAAADMRNAVTALCGRLLAKVRHRRTAPDFDRFSDHRLHDIGFERDWDGSVIPTVTG